MRIRRTDSTVHKGNVGVLMRGDVPREGIAVQLMDQENEG